MAPTEPQLLREHGTTSLLPEKYGSDVLLFIAAGLVGVQRKEFTDLVASYYDGRLGRELAQQKQLLQGVWVVEGEPHWDRNGTWLGRSSFTQKQYLSLQLQIQSEGHWLLFTRSLPETITLVSNVGAWLDRHGIGGNLNSLIRKQKAVNEWGIQTNRDWAIGLLMQFGLGPKLAGRVYDQLGGTGLQWTVDKKELMAVPGIGKVRAEKMVRALDGDRTRETLTNGNG